MQQHLWIIYALSASIMWGLTYVLSEQVYKKISVITTIALSTFVLSFFMLLISGYMGMLKKDVQILASSNKLLGLFIAQAGCLLIAELLIGFSISNKNSTLAGIIETSYPVFIALFAYLLFKENQINLSTITGAILIFAGIIIIYYFNR